MSELLRALAERRVLLDVPARNGHELFSVAARLFAADGLDEGPVVRALLERERLGSTGLGLGVAVPHARVEGACGPLAAFVRPEQALPFAAPDERPVAQFLFMIFPHRATDEHLRLIARAASVLASAKVREGLRTAESPREALRIIAEAPA